MKFFTPELLIRFNSSDDAMADRADEDWETAIRDYRRHLDELSDQMSAQLKKLAGLCLHDAELLAVDEPMGPFFPVPSAFLDPHWPGFLTWAGFAILSVKQGDEIITLIYLLSDHIHRHASIETWPFSTARKHWLYDEIDVDPMHPGMFIHRVLMSNGTVLEIPFFSVLIHDIPLQEGHEGDGSRRIA